MVSSALEAVAAIVVVFAAVVAPDVGLFISYLVTFLLLRLEERLLFAKDILLRSGSRRRRFGPPPRNSFHSYLSGTFSSLSIPTASSAIAPAYFETFLR